MGDLPMTVQDILAEMEEDRGRLLEEWTRVPEGWRRLRPEPQRWSPTEILDHVSRVQGSVLRVLRRILGEADEASLPPALTDLSFVSSIERFQLPNRKYRVTAPDFAGPDPRRSDEEIFRDLETGSRDLMDLAERWDAFDLSQVSHSHEVLGDLNVYQWLRFVAQHDLRHMDQIREAGEVLRGARKDLQTIPGVGPSIGDDLLALGFRGVEDLLGRDPERLYAELVEMTGAPVDRCVLYVFRCAVYFAETPSPDPERLKWWNWKG